MQNGPARMRDRSSTLMPDRGPGAAEEAAAAEGAVEAAEAAEGGAEGAAGDAVEAAVCAAAVNERAALEQHRAATIVLRVLLVTARIRCIRARCMVGRSEWEPVGRFSDSELESIDAARECSPSALASQPTDESDVSSTERQRQFSGMQLSASSQLLTDSLADLDSGTGGALRPRSNACCCGFDSSGATVAVR